MKKRIISLLLCMALLIGVMPMGLFTLTASAETVPEIQNIHYEYDSQNNLWISFDGVPGAKKYWINNSYSIKNVTEEDNKGIISYIIPVTYFYQSQSHYIEPVIKFFIEAENLYGETIAKTENIRVQAPFKKCLEPPKNVYLSKDGILAFDKVEGADYYDVEMRFNGKRIAGVNDSEKNYVDFSEYVREGDVYDFYIWARPKTMWRDYCPSETYVTITFKSNPTLTGSVYIDNNYQPVFGGFLCYLDDLGDVLSYSYHAFYNGGWHGIVAEDRYKYDPSMLRVTVYAEGYEGHIRSADNRYTTPDTPYIATDYAGLKEFFDIERDITVETAYVQLGGNITYTAEEDEDFTLETHGCNVEIDLCGYTLDVLKTPYKDFSVVQEILFNGKNGAIIFKDSGKYDSSTGTTKSGKVNFGYKNYDKNDTVGSATMMEGEITVYGGEYKVSAHSALSRNRHRVISGSAVKVYGGKFTADVPVVLSYTDKEGYGIFGGTFETLNDACCYINDPKVISNIKSGIFLNSSGNKTASVFQMLCETFGYSMEYYTDEFRSQFSGSTAVYIDGVRCADVMDNATIDKRTNSMTYLYAPHFKEKAEIKQILTIDNLDLTVTAPTYNAMPSNKITGGDNTLYETTLVWDTYVDKKYKEVTEPFELGVEYRARVKITPRNGSEIYFSDGAVKINGKEASYNGTYYLAHFTVNGTAITKETVPGSITVGKELGKVFSNSTNATVAGTLWYHNGSVAASSEKVTNGKYYATVYLKANDGYVFTKTSIVNIFGSNLKLSDISSDGKSAYVNTETITITCDHKGDTSAISSDDKNHWHICTVCGMTYGYAAHDYKTVGTVGSKTTYECKQCGYQKVVNNGKETIDYVLVSTADTPFLAIGDTLPEVDLGDYYNSKITLSQALWTEGTSRDTAVTVAPGATVKDGMNYYLAVSCYAKDGYYFGETPSVRICNTYASAKNKYVSPDGNNLIVLIEITPQIKTTANIVLPEMTVGKTYGDVLDEIKTSSLSEKGVLYEIDAEFEIDGVEYWFYLMPDYGNVWNATSYHCPVTYETFKNMTVKPGTEYKLNLKLMLSYGTYYVAKNDVIVENGYLADSFAVSADNNNLVSVKAIFTTEGDGTDISFIKLDVAEPLAGNTPINTAKGEVRYKVEKVEWDGTLKSGKFTCNQTYTVKLTVSPNDGYSFTDIAMATVNNNSASILKSGDKRIISYTFAKCGHNYNVLKYDGSNHWYECGCGAKTDEAGHIYDNACDTDCNECGATRTVTHAYKTTVTKATTSKDGKSVKKCTVCGKVASTTTIKKVTSFKLSTITYTYDGKTKKPSVTVKDSAGKTLKNGTDYTVTYASGRKYVGKYTVKITLKGNYSGSKSLSFKINPKKTSVSKITAGKKSLKVTVKKVTSQATGYQIQYSTSKKFTSAKTKTISSYKTTSATIKSLKAKKTYYVRVRVYKKTSSGTKYYSAWSTYKYKKTK